MSLVFEVLALAVHDGLELLEVAQLDLELLKLRLDEQRHRALDLLLLVERQLARLDRRGRQCRRRRVLDLQLGDRCRCGRLGGGGGGRGSRRVCRR